MRKVNEKNVKKEKNPNKERKRQTKRKINEKKREKSPDCLCYCAYEPTRKMARMSNEIPLCH